MADLSITASNLVPSSTITKTARINSSVVGALPAGSLVTQATDGTITLLNVISYTPSNIYMALTTGYADQTIALWSTGNITVGSILSQGTVYYASPNDGNICPVSDLLDGTGVYPIGIAVSDTLLSFRPWLTGVTLPGSPP